MPEISAEAVLSGDFMADFEAYTLDQFPLRDGFRTLKAVAALGIFGPEGQQRDLCAGRLCVEARLSDGCGVSRLRGEPVSACLRPFSCGQGHECIPFRDPRQKLFYGGGKWVSRARLCGAGRPRAGRDGFRRLHRYFPPAVALSYYRTDTHWRQEKSRTSRRHFSSRWARNTPGNIRNGE